MINNGQEFWTYELSADTITITQDMGLTALSFVLVSGNGTYLGSAKAGSIVSTPIAMTQGQPITITTDSNNPISNWTITTDGVVSIIGKP